MPSIPADFQPITFGSRRLQPNGLYNGLTFLIQADKTNVRVAFVDEIDPMNRFEMEVVSNNRRSL